jgi:hypothetical protein
MLDFVLVIFFGCAVAKIRQAIVHLVAIKMPNLHSFWSWAKKSSGNKSVNGYRCLFSVDGKSNIWIAGRCICVPFNDLPDHRTNTA